MREGCAAEEVKDRTKVKDRVDEEEAFTFIIETSKSPEDLNSGILDRDGKIYKKKFYAHDPQILVSLSVILDNLNGEQIKRETPFLKDLNYQLMKEKFNLLDKDRYLSFVNPK